MLTYINCEMYRAGNCAIGGTCDYVGGKRSNCPVDFAIDKSKPIYVTEPKPGTKSPVGYTAGNSGKFGDINF